jgi:hypothetical protein
MSVGLYCAGPANDGDSGGESMTHQACRAQERVAHLHHVESSSCTWRGEEDRVSIRMKMSVDEAT